MSAFIQQILTKYLGRKLVQSFIVLILSYIALMNGKINGQEWVLSAGLCLGTYAYGNIREAAATKSQV